MAGEGAHARLPLRRWQLPGHCFDGDAATQPTTELLSHVLRRLNEPAEHDHGEAVVEQPANDPGPRDELRVGVATEFVRRPGHGAEPAGHGGVLLAGLAAGHHVGSLFDVLEIQHGGPADLVGLRGRLTVGSRSPRQHRGGRRCGAGGQRSQQPECRPPADPGAVCSRLVRTHRGPGVGDDLVEECPVGSRQVVGDFRVLPLGELRIRFEVAANVAAAALHEVAGEMLTVAPVRLASKRFGEVGEFRGEQSEQRPEWVFLARVRRGGHEDEMALGVLGQPADEFVALVAARAAGVGTDVGLVDDDEFRAGADELVAAQVGLDVVDRDHDVGVLVEDRPVTGQASLERGGGGGKDELRVDVELRGQLGLPLLGEMRRAKHACTGDVALVEQLAGDERRLDGLADPDVVGDKQPHGVLAQRHEQGHQLVGAGRHGKVPNAAERARAVAEPQHESITQQLGGTMVAGVFGVRRGERSRLDRLQIGEDAGYFRVRAAERPDHDQFVVGLRQDHPLPSPRPHKRPDGEAHRHSSRIGSCHRNPGAARATVVVTAAPRRTRSGGRRRSSPSRRGSRI